VVLVTAISYCRDVDFKKSISHGAPHIKRVPNLNGNRSGREGAGRGMIERPHIQREWIQSHHCESRLTEAKSCQYTSLPALKFVHTGDDEHAVGANAYVVRIKANIGCLDHLSGLTVVLSNLLA